MKFLQSHIYAMRVQFEDVDAGGYVHHPNYLKFLERGRYAALCEVDFGFERQLASGFTFVVAEAATKYLKPLAMGQEIWVVTRTIAVRRSSLKVVQAILARPPTGVELEVAGDGLHTLPQVAFHGQLRFVYMDLGSGAACELPSGPRQLLGIPEGSFFESHPERRDTRLMS